MRDLEADGIVAEVDLPEHRAAVLPEGRAHVARAERRGLPPPPRRPARPQPVARRVVRRVPRPAGRHRPDPAERRRRSGRATSTGSPTTACAAACCCPGIPPGAPIAPMHAPVYDPVWQACEERGVDRERARRQPLPRLRRVPGVAVDVADGDLVVLAPAAVDLHHERRLRPVPDAAPRARRAGQRLDPRGARARWTASTARSRNGNVGELRFVEPQLLERTPSEYWDDATARSPPASCTATTAPDVTRIGIDHIMWGSDYPHMEGTFPFSREAMQMTFAGVAARRGRGDARRQRGADLRLRPRQARADRRGVRSVGERRRRGPRPRARRRRAAWRSSRPWCRTCGA